MLMEHMFLLHIVVVLRIILFNMEIVRKTRVKITKNGNKIRYAIFKCPFCLQEVERQISNGLKQISCGCQHFELLSNSLKGKSKSEEHRQKLAKANKGKKQTEEAKRKIGKANKGKIISEETRKKQSEAHRGELASNWQDGKSFEIYPMEFNKGFKRFIYERDNYTCQDPNCEHKTNILDAHHIDYNKKNNNSDNIITLCRSCHAKTNGKNNRQYWTEFYQNTMINRIMDCFL